MDDVTATIASVWSDARRASVPGAIGDRIDRPGQIVADSIFGGDRREFAPSASALSIAIDGPGLFVLEDGGRRSYGRLGDFRIDPQGTIVDGAGRAVLGHRLAADGSCLIGIGPIRVAREGATKGADSVTIDERGTVLSTIGGHATAVGRIVLAIFPSPERLQRKTETTAIPTSAAGQPIFELPGIKNVGSLRAHQLETGIVDLQGDLAELWRLGRREESRSTAAFTDDVCTRTALGLVK
jgi:flagellar hook protein FlgE